jgi:hypothetical protein
MDSSFLGNEGRPSPAHSVQTAFVCGYLGTSAKIHHEAVPLDPNRQIFGPWPPEESFVSGYSRTRPRKAPAPPSTRPRLFLISLLK